MPPGMDWIGSKCAGPHSSFACFEPEFDHSRDTSITSHPEAPSAQQSNAVKLPDGEIVGWSETVATAKP